MLQHNDFANFPIKDWSSDWTDVDIAEAIKSLSPDEMQTLLSQRTTLGDSVIHVAARKKLRLSVSALLDRGAKINDAGDMNDTPLHVAAYNGDRDMVILLLLAKADCNVRRYNGEMPIHVAAMMGAANVVDALVVYDVKQLSVQGREGRTAFIQAINSGSRSVLDVLAKHGDDVNQINLYSGLSAMHIAALKGDQSLIKFLVDRGANINQLSLSGMTPLQYCITQKKPSLDTLQILLSHGANINAGKRPTMEILERYHDKESPIAKFLIERGVTPVADSHRPAAPGAN